jgi:hypothetical protein
MIWGRDDTVTEKFGTAVLGQQFLDKDKWAVAATL